MKAFGNIMHPFILAVLVLGAVACLWGCSKTDPKDEKPFERLQKDHVLQSKLLNYPIKFAVLLPEGYNLTTERYPVVYLLHGWDDNQNAWHSGGAIQYFADRHLSETGPMIFVMPQGFNTYYVNRYNGAFPYMNMFVSELVPAVDSMFRTQRDKSRRAVMGYSMGGYGAMILPMLNPNVFEVSVPLSMSFRTDEQYMNQSQSSWDNQFGIVFGGVGSTGPQRLNQYFKAHSPFHLFAQDNLSAFSRIKFFMDCGDDEESLHITNGVLHNLMRDKNIAHEYRVRNGGHSWNYWHSSMAEALQFISKAFANSAYPADPNPVMVNPLIAASQYQTQNSPSTSKQIGIFLPASYNTQTDSLSVIYLLHDYKGVQRQEKAIQSISLLNNKMNAGILPAAVIVEIPIDADGLEPHAFASIIEWANNQYRISRQARRRVVVGNELGGAAATALMPHFKTMFNACFIFNAQLPNNTVAATEVYYYIDVTDKSSAYRENFNFFVAARAQSISHDYRVRQGTHQYQSFINGLDAAATVISSRLKI